MSTRDARRQAELFAAVHLAECSRDVLAWRRTGLLPPECRLLELSVLCEKSTPTGTDDSLQTAEYLVVCAALERAATS